MRFWLKRLETTASHESRVSQRLIEDNPATGFVTHLYGISQQLTRVAVLLAAPSASISELMRMVVVLSGELLTGAFPPDAWAYYLSS